MGRETITLGDIEIEKTKFCHSKSPIFKKDVDIEKVLVPKKSFGKTKNQKYFIGYLYNDQKVKRLHIMPPEISASVISFDGQTKWMYFLIEDDGLLEKYNTIWDKVNTDIKDKLIASQSTLKNF